MKIRSLTILAILSVLSLILIVKLVVPISITNTSAASLNNYKQSLLIIKLQIDTKRSLIEPVSIVKSYGYLPDYKNPNATEYIKIDITSNKTPRHLYIPISNEIISEEFNIGGSPTKAEIIKPEIITKTIVVPYIQNSEIVLSKDFKEKKASTTISQNTTSTMSGNETFTTQMYVEAQKVDVKTVSINTSTLPLEDYQVETVFDGDVSITDPAQTLDIVFFSSNYNESQFDQFRQFTDLHSDILAGIENYPGINPFNKYKQKIKIRRVISSDVIQYEDYDSVISILTELGVPYDQLALIYNNYGTSSAHPGEGLLTIKALSSGGVNMVLAHEMGHAFADLVDEYITGYDSRDLNKSYRNCKKDPRYPWIANQPGEAYLGCLFSINNYRPEYRSIMSNTKKVYSFNAPSLYLLEQAFSAYVEEGILILYPRVATNIYRSIDVPPTGNAVASISLVNMSNDPVSYHSYIDPSVSWILQDNIDGQLEAGPNSATQDVNYTIDDQQLVNRGKYTTSLIFEFTNAAGQYQTQTFSISYFVGDQSDAPTLNVASPMSGTIIDSGSSIPISISGQILDPGWKRIEYYYVCPNEYNTMDTKIFDSRTQEPFDGVLDTNINFYNKSFSPGTYSIFAKGYPNMGLATESSSITVEIKAPPGTICGNLSPNTVCSDTNSHQHCFRGAQDCEDSGLTYCCPQNITIDCSIIEDVNCSGTVDSQDLKSVLSYFNAIDDLYTQHASKRDFDFNNYININDASFVLKVIQ